LLFGRGAPIIECVGVARADWYPASYQRRRQWTAFLPLLLPVLVLAGFAAWVLLTPVKTKPLTPAPGYHGSLVWGNGIFAKPPELSAWLRQHGGKYPTWAHKHPHGVNLITVRRRAHPVRHKTKKPASR
jgi:hypothetical protein